MALDIKKYWCWICHALRSHVMETEEKGHCVMCGSWNYAPMGDID